MAKYIDKQAALADLNETYDKMSAFHPQFYNGYQFAVNRLKCFPAADVAPVRHGRWIISQEYNDIIGMAVTKYTCSVCGQYRLSATTLSQATDYCPNCGAKMDGGADNEN